MSRKTITYEAERCLACGALWQRLPNGGLRTIQAPAGRTCFPLCPPGEPVTVSIMDGPRWPDNSAS